ncbi:MAG TPA: DUF3443 family protein [Thermodesulfobacteriota bacterium]|nr:DUF3443 family protein [Thermodesulfobacteriota bacterium]
MKLNKTWLKTSLQGELITIVIVVFALLTLGISRASAQADLVETFVSNPPATTTEKARFWVTDTVKNEGTVQVPPSVAQYYFSATGIKDESSILLSGKRSVGKLNPGQSSRGMALVTVPPETPTGTYHLLACANDTNCFSSAKATQLTAPDLVETSVSDPPASAFAGDSFPVTDTAQNQGNKNAPASITRYYLSSSSVKDNSSILLMGQRSVPSLTTVAPKNTSTGTVTVEIPLGAPEGTYFILACADDTNKVAESNEENNCIKSLNQTTLSPPPNVLQVTVNGSLCSAATSSSYPNKPCVSVTVCSPGSSTDCQTIDDILLDSGSYGLRIFKQTLGSVTLQQEMIGSAALAECVQFGDGSSDWGTVEIGDIILGNEPPVQVPIQVIDVTFATLPANCSNADTSPAEAGFNGILGVGPFAPDCGSDCADDPQNGMYYACIGGTCNGTTVSLSNQVSNPVAFLPVDNNGVIVEIPGVPANGSASVDGQLLLGIGTRSNNTPPASVTTYPTDQFANFLTIFDGQTWPSFLDTGSNGLFFPASSNLPDCSDNPGWFCPSSLIKLRATNRGATGSPSGLVQFEIGNFDTLINSPNNVFPDVGGDIGGGQFFDWGMPFHEGRDVYVGINGQTSSLGTGPYWAY